MTSHYVVNITYILTRYDYDDVMCVSKVISTRSKNGFKSLESSRARTCVRENSVTITALYVTISKFYY